MPNSNEPGQSENVSQEKDIQRVFISIPVISTKKTEPLNEMQKQLAKEGGFLGLPLLKKNGPDVEKNFCETFDFDLLAKVLTTLCKNELIVGRDFNEAIKVLSLETTYYSNHLMVEFSITTSQLAEGALELNIKKNTLIESSSIRSVQPISINHYNTRSTFINLPNIGDIWPGSLQLSNPNALQANTDAIIARTKRPSSPEAHSFFSSQVEPKDGETAAKASEINIFKRIS